MDIDAVIENLKHLSLTPSKYLVLKEWIIKNDNHIYNNKKPCMLCECHELPNINYELKNIYNRNKLIICGNCKFIIAKWKFLNYDLP